MKTPRLKNVGRKEVATALKTQGEDKKDKTDNILEEDEHDEEEEA